MSSQFHLTRSLSARTQQLLNKSIDTLDTLLSGDELSVETRVAIASRVVEFSTMVMATTEEEEEINKQEESTEFQEDSGKSASAVRAIAQTHVQTASTSTHQSSSLVFLPATYVQFDDFLSAEDRAELEEIVREQADRFQATSVVRDNKSQQTNTRHSVVLYEADFPEFSQRLKQKVLDTLPTACTKLNHPIFEPSSIVAQLTAHNDGCFYKRHSDAASVQTSTREMTYVYYFYREPQAFSGGDLRLYDTELNNDKPSSRGTYKTITPRNNSIIFFNSRCLHEVMPVSCPSKDFADSRFTINGWIRR